MPTLQDIVQNIVQIPLYLVVFGFLAGLPFILIKKLDRKHLYLLPLAYGVVAAIFSWMLFYGGFAGLIGCAVYFVVILIYFSRKRLVPPASIFVAVLVQNAITIGIYFLYAELFLDLVGWN